MLSIGAGSQWEVMESWKEDVDHKFGEFLGASKQQIAALEDLQSMVLHLMGKQNIHDEGSPSIGQSTLEERENLNLPQIKPGNCNPTSKNQSKSIPSATGKNAPTTKEKRGPGAGAARKCDVPVKLKANVVTLESSESKLTPLETPNMTSPPIGKEWTVVDCHPPKPVTKAVVDPELQSGARPLPETSLELIQEVAVSEEPPMIAQKLKKANKGPTALVEDVSEKPPPRAEVTMCMSPEGPGEHVDA